VRPDETVVLYAPTHRDYLSGDAALLDVEVLAEALGLRVRVLSRRHYFHDPARTGVEHPRLLDVSAHPRVEDLLAIETDYSSVMFDFAHLDRPIVIFPPDWDAYRRTRGVTFDLMVEPPGVVATSFAELVDAFGTGALADEAATKARAAFRARHCVANDGRASERVVRHVFLGEPVRRPHPSPRRRPVAPAQNRGPEVPQDAPTARAGGDGGVRSAP
jgi:CDP-glycerol glycerophosphotransferase